MTAKYSDIVSDGGLDPRNKFDIAPPQREWVGLTLGERERLRDDYDNNPSGLISAVQMMLKEKNT